MTPCCNTLGKTVETANLVGKTERLKIAPIKPLAKVRFGDKTTSKLNSKLV